MNNSRVLLIILFVLLAFFGLAAKLYDVQVVQSEELKYYAQKQQTRLEKIRAERGFIYDRNNVLLVYNRNDVTVNLDLRMLHASEKNKLAERFTSIFGNSKSHYLQLMYQGSKTISLEKKAPADKVLLLSSIKNSALFSFDDPTRIYQYGSLASHILGYVNKEYVGINGIAKYFEDELNGEDGSRLVERDAIGRIITISDQEMKPAVSGDNLILTIDKNYQAILEEELRKGLHNYQAESSTGILMDPNTGEIIALANIEDYDPNFYWNYSDNQRRNRAITDTYEPGSTFKGISLSALIEENKCKEDELVYVENGKYKFRNTYIRDTHKNTYLTVSGVLEESSNIGMSKLIQRLDDNTFYKYLRGFGFGTYTSITLPGEVKGTLKKPNTWSKLSKTFMSFGYEIAVSPIQLITAYCAIVNGGILYEPHILKRRTDKDGNVRFESSPVVVRRVISENTSLRLKKVLRNVVKNGTGSFADIKQISVGGKTGTSQKLVDGKYSKSKYSASFIGFFPVENPQLVCLIILDSPQKEKYGGTVSAPIFKNITERILKTDLNKYQNAAKFYTDVKRESQLNSADENLNISLNEVNVSSTQTSYKLTGEISNGLMPDLRGNTIKEALVKLNLLGLAYDVKGSGIVTRQSISPGVKVNRNQVCKITCSESAIIGANVY